MWADIVYMWVCLLVCVLACVCAKVCVDIVCMCFFVSVCMCLCMHGWCLAAVTKVKKCKRQAYQVQYVIIFWEAKGCCLSFSKFPPPLAQQSSSQVLYNWLMSQSFYEPHFELATEKDTCGTHRELLKGVWELVATKESFVSVVKTVGCDLVIRFSKQLLL